jgi:hypothetical protein
LVKSKTGCDCTLRKTTNLGIIYSAFGGATIRDGEVVTDPVLPALRIRPQPHDRFPPEAPMLNPFGQWRLELVDVAQN